jgi:hypothetical protein
LTKRRALPVRLGAATLYFLLGYCIVTGLGVLLTVVLAIFEPAAPAGTPMLQIPAYAMSVPFHPLLNLLVWPVLGWIYLGRLASDGHRQLEALRLGFFWVVATAGIDLFGWVLLPQPWRMTFDQFYVGYQPWISLIYLVILLSPILADQVAPAGRLSRESPNSGL